MAHATNTFGRHAGSTTVGRYTREERLAGGWPILLGLGLLAIVLSTGALSQDIRPLPNLDRSAATSASLMTASLAVPSGLRSGMEAFPLDLAAAAGTSASGSVTAMPGAEAAYVVIAPAPKVEERPEEPAANPGRPSLSTSAALVPMGYIQTETGILYASGSAEFDSRTAPEQTLRFTVMPRVEMILNFEPTAASKMDQEQTSRRGDLSEGVQVLLSSGHGARPAVAVSYSRLAKAGSATNLDMGGCTQGALLIASSDFGKFHMDANAFLNEQTAGPVRRGQFGQFLAVSHPVTPKLAMSAELRHFSQPFQGTEGIGLMLAPTYTARPNLVFDAGVARGLTSTSTHWQAVAGVTYLLPRHMGGRQKVR